MWFKSRKQGPDARAQMKTLPPKEAAKVRALVDRRDYLDRILTHWIESSERYTAMLDYIPRINAFLKRVSEARSMEEFDAINTEISTFAEEVRKFDPK